MCCCCCLGVSAKGQLESDPCDHRHLFGVGGEYLKEWRKPSKDLLSSCIEPGAFPQLVFDGLRLLFAKRTQWIREMVEEVGVRSQERVVTGSQGGPYPPDR